MAGTAIERFRAFVNDRHHLGLADYADLHRWSVTDLNAFWMAVWDFYDLSGGGPRPSVALAKDSMPGAEWFPGTGLNYAGRILAHEPSEAPAIVDIGEDGSRSVVTWAQLHQRTGALAQTLRGLGVGRGDRVVGYLPNTSAAIIGLLATASLGAIWSCCGQDYAAKGAADRFTQLEPVVLMAADGYRHGGTVYDRRDQVADLAGRLPSLHALIDVDNLALGAGPVGRGDLRRVGYRQATSGDAPVRVEQVPFDHPLWVLFTSGTTGVPKGIVHGHGGVTVAHLAMIGLQNDMTERDVFFWYTTTNWVMWNMVCSGLLFGATVIAYDGNPLTPTADRLWQIVADERVTVFGTNPGQLLASMKADLHPAKEHDLSALVSVCSTGATLPPSAFAWVSERVGRGVQIGSLSGGTDVAAAWVGPAPTVPVWAGEISAITLGMAVQAWDEHGTPVVGQVGELVVTRPCPSMPLYFWGDRDGARYRDAYFATFPGVWRHGDWITVTDRGSVIIHGRSDATLNRNGVRLGSAEIYDAVEKLPQIAEALVVGVDEPDGGYWLPLFVVLAPGAGLDEQLREAIRTAIRANASPRHVPDDVIAVRALPHTRTGKKIEVPIKRLLAGVPVDKALSLGAVDDPAAVEEFVRIEQRRRHPMDQRPPAE